MNTTTPVLDVELVREIAMQVKIIVVLMMLGLVIPELIKLYAQIRRERFIASLTREEKLLVYSQELFKTLSEVARTVARATERVNTPVNQPLRRPVGKHLRLDNVVRIALIMFFVALIIMFLLEMQTLYRELGGLLHMA